MEIIRKLSLVILTGMLFTYILMSSCKKEVAYSNTKTIIDTIQHAWQSEPEFNGQDQDITVAYTTGNGNAFFYGEQYNVYTYDSIGSQWGIDFFGGPNLYQRPAVNKQLFAKIDYNNFFTIVNPYSYSVPVYADSIKHLDASFSFSPQYNYLPNTNVIDISDSNRIIFPVQTKNNPQSNCYYLIDAKQVNFNANITITNFNKIYLGYVNGVNLSSSTVHIKNRFFVGANDSTYLIREDYSTKLVVPGVIFYSVFQYGGNYYATSSGNYGKAIYETTDNGETWALTYNVNVNRYGFVIINFDGKLIAMLSDQFWLVTLGTASISFKEIVNDGLIGKTITGIIKCNSKVWITTNGGVFYRPYSSFYQFK